MKVINFFFIFLLCYANCLCSDLAMDEDQKRQQEHLFPYKKAPLQSSLSQLAASKGIGQLGSEELPLPRVGQLYTKETTTGEAVLKQRMKIPLPQAGSVVTVYSSNDNKKVNYLSSGDERSQESFAYTQTETYKGSRKYPLKPYNFKFKTENGIVLSFHRGHGIDHADGNKDSSEAFNNYTPQVDFYNQHIRNPLVKCIRKKEGSYKEISIYDDSPTHIDGGTRLPIGYIFMEFYNHTKAHTYYFPNLIAYKSEKDENGDILEGYEEFCKFFEINDEGAFKNSILEQGVVEKHTQAIHDHSWIGHRTLSGRFQIVSEEHGGIPRDAQIALHKMIAYHHLQQAGELEFNSIEQKAALVQIFSSRFKYLTFDRKDPAEEKVRQKKIEKFFEELSKVGISEEEYFYCLSLANPEKLNPERQEKYKKLTEIEKNFKLEEDERGEDLYDLEKAAYYLSLIENQINNKKESTIGEKQILLELYKIPDLRKTEKEKILKNEIMKLRD